MGRPGVVVVVGVAVVQRYVTRRGVVVTPPTFKLRSHKIENSRRFSDSRAQVLAHTP